ncbi:MAG: inositol monophosphatase family protein, partial [Chloroflexota bacterium]
MDRYRAGDFDPSLKADRSVVTLADVASDRLISAAIQAAYPDDLLLSEELSPNLSQFTETQRAVWIIDPLDGTSNFSLGFPFWGVLLAR